MMSPPQVDPPGPGDGSGSATARTAAAGVAALGEASASGVAARRATTLATAPADGRWQQPQLPQQGWPPPEGATAGMAAAGAGPGPKPMVPGPLAARVARRVP